ncbi:lipid droplet-regulating VLDL assembly factor AUP1-like [Frieseomelitta varia]|uniref:lipid droplet-regulating VLDL assembly factor AUP1-like n=1 Tax=Frieseomelitta varia TaxID=561572 RepID=UPI001CB68F1A|nr:lipid droplet-regulating VLDL assembly factor AUP1-like [Frieseomelitta varia]XP_043529305.1 lipid droplet-regulating VLDL assembly factor AUP1-like [Frieseomelitta varia]
MSQIDIQDLFDKSRFPSGWRLAPIFLYTPLGLALALIRLLIALQLWLIAILLPDCNTLRKFLHHGFSFVFGILAKISEGEVRDKQSRIIISNSVSVLDHFALYKATQALSPTMWEVPTAMSNALGLQVMDMSNKETLIASMKQFLSTTNCNVAIQPEFGITNSRVALLKFNSWPFTIEASVQPVTIKAWRPEFISIHLTSLASRRWIDVFWFMFVPYTVFTIKYLKIKQNPDCEVLVREVEKDIATSLGLQTSSHTVLDKKELEKRYIMERTQNRRFDRNSPTSQVIHNIEIQRMVRQVSEVLPLVPHNVILRDLLKTRNVDITIANILDGIVTYTPDSSQTVTRSASLNQLQKSTVKDSSNVGSSSFQERKIKMIREARERYIQKHGLKNC